MKAGQNIRLAPMKNQPSDVNGWVLASNGVKIGLVPTSHIKVLGKRRKNDTRNTAASTTVPGATSYSTQPIIPSTSQGMQDSFSSSVSGQPTLAQDSLSNDFGGGMSSDDDCETLVGDPITDET